MIDVLLAAPGVAREPELVSTASTAGVRIVRRCVDAVDVLAAVATFPQAQPVISASLPRLVSATVDRLGSATVGLAEDREDVDRLRHLGVTRIVRAESTPLWPLLIAAHQDEGISGDVVQAVDMPQPVRCGQVIVVWGPHGAPGRTTVAIGLADALAGMKRRVCLMDADTYAPSIGIALGVQAPGILAACRSVEGQGESDITAFCAQVSPSLSVLPGIGSTDQWPELRSASLGSLWECARVSFDVTVVDVGASLEDIDGDAPWSRRRNTASLSALSAADHVVVVARSSAHGAARLASAWGDLPAGAPRTLVHTRAGRGVSAWVDTVRSLGIDAPAVAVPDDERALARCWAHGGTPSEHGGRSGVGRAMRSLASKVVGD